MDEIHAFLAAACLILFVAVVTLYEQQVTSIVHAVDMRVAGLSALVAVRDDFWADPFSETIVENEILPDESVLQAFCTHLIDIIDDAPLKVENIPETIVQHPGTGFFAANAPGAIHDDVAFLAGNEAEDQIRRIDLRSVRFGFTQGMPRQRMFGQTSGLSIVAILSPLIEPNRQRIPYSDLAEGRPASLLMLHWRFAS